MCERTVALMRTTSAQIARNSSRTIATPEMSLSMFVSSRKIPSVVLPSAVPLEERTPSALALPLALLRPSSAELPPSRVVPSWQLPPVPPWPLPPERRSATARASRSRAATPSSARPLPTVPPWPLPAVPPWPLPCQVSDARSTEAGSFVLASVVIRMPVVSISYHTRGRFELMLSDRCHHRHGGC